MDERRLPERIRQLELWQVHVDDALRVAGEARATYIPMLLKVSERVGIIEARVAVYAAVGGSLAGIVTAVVTAIIVWAISGS